MPRTARASVGDQCYPVLYRGNARGPVFFKEGDYRAFLKALAQAGDELPLRVLAFCRRPNLFHLVLRPDHDRDLGRWRH